MEIGLWSLQFKMKGERFNRNLRGNFSAGSLLGTWNKLTEGVQAKLQHLKDIWIITGFGDVGQMQGNVKST